MSPRFIIITMTPLERARPIIIMVKASRPSHYPARKIILRDCESRCQIMERPLLRRLPMGRVPMGRPHMHQGKAVNLSRRTNRPLYQKVMDLSRATALHLHQMKVLHLHPHPNHQINVSYAFALLPYHKDFEGETTSLFDVKTWFQRINYDKYH